MHSTRSLQGSGLVRTVELCAQTRVAIEMHSWMSSAARFEWPAKQATEPWASERRGGLFFVIPVNSPVDSTFEQSKNVALAHFLVVSSSSCSERCGLHDIRFKVRSLLSVHAHCTEIMDFLWARTVNSSRILATASHYCDIKHTCRSRRISYHHSLRFLQKQKLLH